MSEGNLNNSDHKDMDDFLAMVLDGYKEGKITKESAVGGLAHVMAALDRQNYAEAKHWFKNVSLDQFSD